MMLPYDALTWFQAFILTPYLPFACSFVLAMAMPGRRSLSFVAALATVACACLVYVWWRVEIFFFIWSVHDAYAYDRALLPIVLGLVGGVTLRAFQLRNNLPRLGWISASVFLIGLLVRPDPLFNLYKGG